MLHRYLPYFFSFVIRPGFEPEMTVPKTVVLPLHHRTVLTDLKGRIIPLIILRDGERVSVLWTLTGSNRGPNDYESFALTC